MIKVGDLVCPNKSYFAYNRNLLKEDFIEEIDGGWALASLFESRPKRMNTTHYSWYSLEFAILLDCEICTLEYQALGKLDDLFQPDADTDSFRWKISSQYKKTDRLFAKILTPYGILWSRYDVLLPFTR